MLGARRALSPPGLTWSNRSQLWNRPMAELSYGFPGVEKDCKNRRKKAGNLKYGFLLDVPLLAVIFRFITKRRFLFYPLKSLLIKKDITYNVSQIPICDPFTPCRTALPSDPADQFPDGKSPKVPPLYTVF